MGGWADGRDETRSMGVRRNGAATRAAASGLLAILIHQAKLAFPVRQ
jgi:hypothetical protein